MNKTRALIGLNSMLCEGIQCTELKNGHESDQFKFCGKFMGLKINYFCRPFSSSYRGMGENYERNPGKC